MLTDDTRGQNIWAEACFKQCMATTLYYYRGILDTPEKLVGYIQAN
jgi:hypothetical protein